MTKHASGNITGRWIELLICKIERAKYGLPFGLPVQRWIVAVNGETDTHRIGAILPVH